MLLTVEACTNGTITRACARTLNRALGTSMSGSTLVADAQTACDAQGRAYRVVGAANLTGADKGRHTKEITRSRQAQARREVRQAARIAADQDDAVVCTPGTCACHEAA